MNRLVLLSVLIGVAGISAPARAQKATFKPAYANMTEVGVSLGRVVVQSFGTETATNRSSFTAQTFNGVQLRPRLALGATLGVDWYAAALLMPVSAGLRYDLVHQPQRNVRVFGSFDTGYGTTLLQRDINGDRTTGGWYVSPGVGLRLGKPGMGAFVLTMSYKRQAAHVARALNDFYLARDEDRVYNRIVFRLGVAF